MKSAHVSHLGNHLSISHWCYTVAKLSNGSNRLITTKWFFLLHAASINIWRGYTLTPSLPTATRINSSSLPQCSLSAAHSIVHSPPMAPRDIIHLVMWPACDPLHGLSNMLTRYCCCLWSKATCSVKALLWSSSVGGAWGGPTLVDHWVLHIPSCSPEHCSGCEPKNQMLQEPPENKIYMHVLNSYRITYIVINSCTML